MYVDFKKRVNHGRCNAARSKFDVIASNLEMNPILGYTKRKACGQVLLNGYNCTLTKR
jgi:hypothetical protein